MYYFMCFILLVSLEGLKAKVQGTSESTSYPASHVSHTSTINNSQSITNITNNNIPNTISSTSSSESIQKYSSMSPNLSTVQKSTPGSHILCEDCLINLKDKKEMVLWLMIAFLFLICIFLLVIIMCMACKCHQSNRKGELVLMKSSASTKKNSVNGGPSETEVMLKDSSLVKMEDETTPDENEEPEEAGLAAADVKTQDSAEENKNSDNDTSEATPTQEADQSDKTDLKTEDLENAG